MFGKDAIVRRKLSHKKLWPQLYKAIINSKLHLIKQYLKIQKCGIVQNVSIGLFWIVSVCENDL
jgi:hypothetical protein